MLLDMWSMKSDITQEGTQYRIPYVLLAYNSEEATKMMMNRMKRDKMIYSRIRSTSLERTRRRGQQV